MATDMEMDTAHNTRTMSVAILVVAMALVLHIRLDPIMARLISSKISQLHYLLDLQSQQRTDHHYRRTLFVLDWATETETPVGQYSPHNPKEESEIAGLKNDLAAESRSDAYFTLLNWTSQSWFPIQIVI
jgi:hypothetical protein